MNYSFVTITGDQVAAWRLIGINCAGGLAVPETTLLRPVLNTGGTLFSPTLTDLGDLITCLFYLH